MTTLREAAQQATPREQLLKELMDSRVPKTEREHAAVREIERLRVALAEQQDWSELEALRESLREHMAEIHRLRAAGRQALDAFDSMYGRKPERVEEVITTLRATLSWDAMQRLTDEQKMIERGTKAWADVPNATAFVEDLRGNEHVTDRHEKEGDNLSPPLDHVPDATKMMAMRMPKEGDRVICIEDESVGTVQWTSAAGGPYIKFEDGSRGQWSLREFGVLFRYADAPPQRKPLTEEQLVEAYCCVNDKEWAIGGMTDARIFARAIERAHGIGGEE